MTGFVGRPFPPVIPADAGIHPTVGMARASHGSRLFSRDDGVVAGVVPHPNRHSRGRGNPSDGGHGSGVTWAGMTVCPYRSVSRNATMSRISRLVMKAPIGGMLEGAS